VKYYLIAGERSGDLHGGNLIQSLKALDTEAAFRGFGGDHMEQAGMKLVVHYRDMAFMGLLALVTHARTILQRMKHCKTDILAFRPDVVILIDYGGFNRKIAAFCKNRSIKVFYYISPKVWAWYPRRALELKRNVTRMFCILPFEQNFYKTYGWDVDYVGNPVLDAIKAFAKGMWESMPLADSHMPLADTHQPVPPLPTHQNSITKDKTVALLPGSRKHELDRIIPLMVKVVDFFPDCNFVVAAVTSVPPACYQPFSKPVNVKIVFDATYDLLSNAQAAIVTSGTATLETALFNVPQVVVYKASWFEFSVARLMLRVQFVSLVNLIANREVIRELLQENATVSNVQAELQSLLTEGAYRNKMLAAYDELFQKLDIGSASANTARLMVGYLTT